MNAPDQIEAALFSAPRRQANGLYWLHSFNMRQNSTNQLYLCRLRKDSIIKEHLLPHPFKPFITVAFWFQTSALQADNCPPFANDVSMAG